MAMNTFELRHLLTLQPGRTRQASSFDRDPERGGTWFGFRPLIARRKRIQIDPGETHTMASLKGAGLITRLWMTTFLPTNSHALRSLVLRFYWDDESQPSVECPFGDFFGAPFGRYVYYTAQPMSLTSGAFNSLWPMPYDSSARLEITNEGTAAVEPFFYHVTYYQIDEPLKTDLRFHAQWRRDNPTQPDIPYTILDAQGTGHYVGAHLFMQNREWWLRPPLSKIAFPYGFGMGMMEGWESIYVDGETMPSVIGTGTEDYFSGAWYYIFGGKFSAPYHGCTVRDYVRGQIAAYRFDVLAPVPFHRNIHVTIDHGFENQLACDYASIAYWYQREPHQAFSPLPEVATRRPTSPYTNAIQAALMLGMPVLMGATLMLRLWKRLFR